MGSWADKLLRAYDEGSALSPLSESAGLSVTGAYEIAEELRQLRTARGEVVRGWKIGFTNRTIWDEYDVHAPIWGPMYSTTIGEHTGEPWRVSQFHEPRIEAEIAFRLGSTPVPGSGIDGVLDCVDAVCHGFEIVQSPFPGWRFRPVDTMAAGGLHGNFVHGPWASISAPDRSAWHDALPGFSLRLRSDTGVDDLGVGSNVLDSPLAALSHFVDAFDGSPYRRGIEAGDIVTTGTVARAFPIAAGERWWTELDGLPLAGLEIVFA